MNADQKRRALDLLAQPTTMTVRSASEAAAIIARYTGKTNS